MLKSYFKRALSDLTTCSLMLLSSYTLANSFEVESLIKNELQQRPSQFSLQDIPVIDDQRPIRVVVEKGHGRQLLLPYVIPHFTAHTGIEVQITELTLDQLGHEQRQSILNLTGQYDLVTVEGSWIGGWADQSLLYPLDSLVRRFDTPSNFSSHVGHFYPALVELMTYQQQLYALPYTNYTMVNHYRADLFEHPNEKRAFLERYGYPLVPPSNSQQLIDIAEFFTRQAGEKLADKTLTHNSYGVALMGGYSPHVGDEFSSLLWGLGGSWFTPLYHSNQAQPHGFEVPEHNIEFIQASKLYLQLIKFAPPQVLSSSWLEASQQFASGHIAMFPFAYNNLWPRNAAVQQHSGARIAAAQTPLGRPYFGGYGMGIPIDARNSEAAYWFLKYLTSFESQFANALNQGSPCRSDVVTHPYFKHPQRHLVSGAFNQGHLAISHWNGELRNKGHYTSIAMQHIYDDLQETAYAVASQRLSPQVALTSFNSRIRELQNQYGRYPVKVSHQED